MTVLTHVCSANVGQVFIAEEANASSDVLPLTDDQKAELDRRIAEFDADPSIGIPMDQVLERIQAKLRRPK
jgi:putative addiction module component (TIGR02574 family)